MYHREDPCRVVFSKLSEQCDEAVICELAIQFGPIRHLSFPSDPTLSGTMQRKTFCFVDFYHPEDAKYCFQVLSRTPVKLFGTELKVTHVSTEWMQRERAGGGSGFESAMVLPDAVAASSSGKHVRGLHEIGAKVRVKNIPVNTTEFEIQTFFEQFGAFAAPPRLIRNRAGIFRGTVILSYADFAFSDRVIREMNERKFRDRIITVQYALLEDGSGRLHGSAEERANARLIQEEERKYRERVEEVLKASRQEQRQRNTAWADPNFNKMR